MSVCYTVEICVSLLNFNMKGVYSHAWLQTFFEDSLPSPETIRDGLLRHSFEVEDVRVADSGDTVYVLDVLPDRSADCLAHYGIAKEIAAIFSLKLTRRYFSDTFSFRTAASYIQMDRCDRYTILKFENISLSETPKEISCHLEAVGQRCITPLADLSNYVLLDIGQPIHVFDARKVSGSFSVRQARDGETFLLLGGEEVVLCVDDIVIADAVDDRVIALAGVKGGEDTKVAADTTDVYIEVASFDHVSVRRTMRRTGCVSDAALRFSQGFPAELIDYTAHRVAAVFGEYGSLTDSFDDTRTALARQRKTGFSVSEVNALLGTVYTQEDIAAALDRFNYIYQYLDSREQFIAVAQEQLGTPYMWGASVSRNAPDAFDCSSFVCWCAAQAGKSLPRISVNQYVYATPVSVPKPGDLVFSISSDPKAEIHTEYVFEAGFPVVPGTVEQGVSHVGIVLDTETFIDARGDSGVTVSQLADATVVGFRRIWDEEKRFVISLPVERPDLRDAHDMVEEIGRLLGYDAVPSIPPLDGFLDTMQVAWARTRNQVLLRDDAVFRKRAAVLSALQGIGFSEVITSSFSKKGVVCVVYPVAKDKGCLRVALRDGMEESLARNAYNGELLGVGAIQIAEIGSVFTDEGEEVRLALGVRETLGRSAVDAAAVEAAVKTVLDLPGGFEGGVWEVPLADVSVRGVSRGEISLIGVMQYVPPSKYPFVLRDVAMFVPDGSAVFDVEKLLSAHGGDYLRQINLFDSFEKDGRKSYAFRLVFQSDTETLDDAVVNRQMEELYGVLRDGGYEVR